MTASAFVSEIKHTVCEGTEAAAGLHMGEESFTGNASITTLIAC